MSDTAAFLADHVLPAAPYRAALAALLPPRETPAEPATAEAHTSSDGARVARPRKLLWASVLRRVPPQAELFEHLPE